MGRLRGALDNDILVAVQRFIENGVPADVVSLYTALQRSNSSLKRQRKNLIEASIDRVLEHLQDTKTQEDSEVSIEDIVSSANTTMDDLMNKSLRSNLMHKPGPETTEGRKRREDGQPSQKRQKLSNTGVTTVSEHLSLEDIGGMEDVIRQLKKSIVMPLQYPHVYSRLDIPVPKGVLLHGPPGCGKTMIARTFAAALGKPFVEILGPAIVSGMSGESEKGIRDRFEEARKNAPCVLFIDEIDAIAPKRDSSGSQMEKRIVAQLLVSMDELSKDPSKPVVVLAATNRPDSIDPALRRGGRFGKEINIPVPNEQVRKRILLAQTRKKPIDSDVNFDELAKKTAGFVGSDLHELVAEASLRKIDGYEMALEQQAIDYNLYPNSLNSGDGDGDGDAMGISNDVLSVRRLIARSNRSDLPEPAGFQNIVIRRDDFLSVLPNITPSSKREGFATVPDVSWRDVGALESVRQELHAVVVDPIQRPQAYRDFNLPTSSGVLLWGPPGCGKTLLAKAVAAESEANFISIKGPELLNKFVGESEASVRKVFTRARSSVPCIIFFDELDALVPRRNEAGSEASARVVNTLLTELDGISDRDGIHIIAATNRPDMIDEAMLRPGRLETQLFIDLPGPEERIDILKALARARPCKFTHEIEELARQRCDNFSGADLGSLLNKATKNAMRRRGTTIEFEDFEMARQTVQGSVQDAQRYRQLNKRFGRTG